MDVSRRTEIAQSRQDVHAKALYFKRENEGMLEARDGFDDRASAVRGTVAVPGAGGRAGWNGSGVRDCEPFGSTRHCS